MDGSSARGGAGEGDAGLGLLGDGGEMAVTEVLDDRGLHRELDQVHGQEPDDVLQGDCQGPRR